MMTTTTRRALSVLLLAAAPLVAVAAAVAYQGRVPDPLPSHWDLGGSVDGTTGFAGLTTMTLILTVLAAVVATVVLRRAGDNRALASTAVLLGWTGWLVATLYAGTLAAADGVSSAAEVGLRWWLPVAVIVVPVLVAAVLYRLLPAATSSFSRPAGDLVLRPGEHVAWIGSARSRPMSWLAAALVPAGVVLAIFEPVAGAILAVVGLVLWWTHVVTVRVDRRGVRAGWGPLHWPAVSIPADRLEGAEATDIEPMAWGGWGYRLSGRGVGVIVRRGPGLVLHRRGGSDLAVTVDAPEDAVALVNALAAQR